MTNPAIPITLTPDSSQLHGYGYDAATQTLALEFKSNHQTKAYLYPGFTAEQMHDFINAESQGSFFYKHIKKQWEGKFVMIDKTAQPDPHVDVQPTADKAADVLAHKIDVHSGDSRT